MRRLITFLLLFVFSLVLSAAPAPAATAEFPTEIRLASGAVLRNTSLIRWTSDGAVVKHAGGADPIRFATVAEPDRARLLAAKGQTTAQAAKSAGDQRAAAAAPRKISGSVFITTRGAGAYKFAGTEVLAFPQEYAAQIDSRKQFKISDSSQHVAGSEHVNAWIEACADVPVLGRARTDADGRFELAIPAQKPVVLFCLAKRARGKVDEVNVWLVKVGADASAVNLDGEVSRTYYQGGR